MKKPESKRLLEEAEKLYKQGIDKLQDEVLLSVELLREELVEIANELRGNQTKNELIEELKRLLPVVRRLVGEDQPQPQGQRARAPKTTTADKIAWLTKKLAGRDGQTKSELLQAYVVEFKTKESPTLLDSALKSNRFRTEKSGRNVLVYLKD